MRISLDGLPDFSYVSVRDEHELSMGPSVVLTVGREEGAGRPAIEIEVYLQANDAKALGDAVLNVARGVRNTT